MTESVGSLKVKKFDGKINFNLWKVDMYDLLVHHGLHRALKGDKGKPTTMEDEEYEDICLRALSLIRLCLADEIKCNILDEKSAASLWARLNTDFTGSSLLDRMYWKRKLFRFSMKEGTTLHDHLMEFNKVVSELSVIGSDDLSEENKAFCLIYSLPESYEHLISTMLHGRSAKEELTVAGVVRGLKEDELRKETCEQTGGRSLSCLAIEGNQGEPSSAKKGGFRCHFCGKKGHYKKDCRKLKKREEVNTVSAVFDSEVLECLLIADSCETDSNWYLDSGSSSHVCSDRGMFATYTSTTGRSLRTGTGEDCTVAGEGTIEFVMPDGKEFILQDVKHVPSMKRNLVSLGTLEARGCRYAAQGGVLTVWRGRRKVMRGKRVAHHNLYRLNGNVKARPSVLKPDVPEASSVPPLGSPTRDSDVRISSRGGDSLGVGGVRAGDGDSVSTPISGIRIGGFRFDLPQ